MTSDPSIIKDSFLRQLFEYGGKFRQNISPSVILDAIEYGLNEYINIMLSKNRGWDTGLAKHLDIALAQVPNHFHLQAQSIGHIKLRQLRLQPLQVLL
jgi:hypothetical protein